MRQTLFTQKLVAPGPAQDIREHRKLLKTSSQIGSQQAEINCLHTCANNNVLPPGFKMKWPDVTGIQSPGFKKNISNILVSSSKSLINEVICETTVQFTRGVAFVREQKTKVSGEIFYKAVANYNFTYNQVSQRLTSKLKKISSLNYIKTVIPHLPLLALTFTLLLAPALQRLEQGTGREETRPAGSEETWHPRR